MPQKENEPPFTSYCVLSEYLFPAIHRHTDPYAFALSLSPCLPLFHLITDLSLRLTTRMIHSRFKIQRKLDTHIFCRHKRVHRVCLFLCLRPSSCVFLAVPLSRYLCRRCGYRGKWAVRAALAPSTTAVMVMPRSNSPSERNAGTTIPIFPCPQRDLDFREPFEECPEPLCSDTKLEHFGLGPPRFRGSQVRVLLATNSDSYIHGTRCREHTVWEW